jgi:hypothetical protein
VCPGFREFPVAGNWAQNPDKTDVADAASWVL